MPGIASSLRCISSRSLKKVCKTSKFCVVNYRRYTTTPTRLIDLQVDSFLQGNSSNYVDEMYAAWIKDPSSVHVSWQAYFKNLSSGVSPTESVVPPPGSSHQANFYVPPSGGVPADLAGQKSTGRDILAHMKVQLLVRAYQVRGHHRADIDPLNIRLSETPIPRELTLEHYGFTEKNLDDEYVLGPGILERFITDKKKTMNLREIIETCKKVYCGSYGIEYVHIPEKEPCDWLRSRIEIPTPFQYTADEKRRILDRLIWADSFERFLATKYPNDKRFGLEGCESLIPGMKALIDHSVDRGVKAIVIGMPHRGRLNVLSNVVRKPNEAIFSEFAGLQSPDEEGSGDVKYHLGMNYERPTPSGRRVNLSLVANPSHLEAEDPIVLGKTRAIQFYSNDEETHAKSMGLLLHGDAAFAAQGIVYETMGFHVLPGYSVGGTIHIIVNNQIGFTTDPRFARSTAYPSDVSKCIDAPIVHVNADDVEALTFVCQLASEWRATYKSDFIIDLVCYRKYGHNETDQPSFTQPRMYKAIAKKKSILDLYSEKLIKEGTFTRNEIDEHKNWVWGLLEESFKNASDYTTTAREWLTAAWVDLPTPKDLATKVLDEEPTAVDTDILKMIGKRLSSVPENFKVHKNLVRVLQARGKSLESGESIDMSTGEALAFGTLLLEGNHVRVSGQDVERGTFSQRHAVLHDQENESIYIPLNHIKEGQQKFVIRNSSLSEFGVLGFEYGYSLNSPHALVMWEAQFGDFANNAQCIIDQFIVSGESKWLQRSGLVLSLPHGYDGQGPEHSNAHIERFLQLCNEPAFKFPSKHELARQHQDANIQVVMPTTPANLFHILRRQLRSKFRKPLIVFFSKSLLRHPLARSSIEEFTGNSKWQWIIKDTAHQTGEINDASGIKRLVICSGQVWAKFSAFRSSNGIKDTASVRIEQLHPFPYAPLRDVLNEYPNLEDIVYLAEEHYNFSPACYVEPRLKVTIAETIHSDKTFRIVSRPLSASPATGNKIVNQKEEASLMTETFGIN